MLDAKETLERLPAQVRAQLAWTQKPIHEGIARLRSEPLSDTLIEFVVAQVNAPFHALGRIVWERLAANRDELRALLMQDFGTRANALRAFLPGADGRDTLEWVVGLLRSFCALSLDSFTPEQGPLLDNEAWNEALHDPIARAYVGGLFCFLAASDEARLGSDHERAHEFLDIAFLQLTNLRDAVREIGLWLSPFPFETLAERRANLVRDADRLREALSDDDWTALEQARVRDLR